MKYSINLEFDVKNTIKQLLSDCEDCYPSDGLKAKLDENRPLFIKLGVDVYVAENAGNAAYFSDLEYEAAGAKICIWIC